MRIVCISDTHTSHKKPFGDNGEYLPEGDILLCAGDITNIGDPWDVFNFANSFTKTNFKHKITIAGNHDFCFERQKLLVKDMLEKSGWTYLQDEEVVVEGLKIYGSPWQPEFNNWAFNLPRGEKLKRVWDNIPLDSDIVITHGPPHGILDFVHYDKIHVGCEELLPKILEVKPKLHLFGHIHETYGVFRDKDITFVNASICNLKYQPINRPIVFDINTTTGLLEEVII